MASLNLEVGVDAAGVVKGSKDAFQALVQLTNATRHLMDGLEAMNGANGAMGKFGALMSRASPYIMAATAAMGAISLAMNVFSGKTNEAADAQQRLAEEIAKARKEQDLARSLGESTVPGAQAERAAIRRAMGDISGPVGLSTFAKANGIPDENVMRWLATRGDEESLSMLERGSVRVKAPPGWWATDNGYRNFDRSDFGQYKQITPEQQRAMLEARYRVSGYNVNAAGPEPVRADMSSWDSYPGSLSSRGPVGSPVGMGINFPQIAAGQQFNGVYQSEQGQADVSYENFLAKKRQQDQEQLRVMQETEQMAQNVGHSLGAAATQFVFKLASGREILAGIIMQMAQAGLTQAATNAASGIFKSFNSTPTQRTPGVNP